MYQLVDYVTKKAVSPEQLVFADTQAPWEVVMDMAQIKSKINIDYFKIAAPSLSKYLPFLPIKSGAEFVSLREMATPLVKSKMLNSQLGIDLYFKVEGCNPTGSFKDRGSAIELSVAKEMGAKAIILASTGNMAASCACYAAAAKLPCFVLVPEGVSMTKLAQVVAFGGQIVQVKGTYNDAAKLAQEIAYKMGFYLAGDYAFRVEGQKTAAFEMVEQMLYQPPDLVVVPIGCGTNIASYAKGFFEYQQLGFIDKIPQLVGVQAEGAAAVVKSYTENSMTITPLSSADTIAAAIAVTNPIDGIKALDAIYLSNGCAVSVTDAEILHAKYLLSSTESLFVESAAAATVAALIKMKQLNALPQKKVVCVLTGDGLKDAHVVLQSISHLPTIKPEEKEYLSIFKNKHRECFA